MTDLEDVISNQVITAVRQNLINSYIQHGTHKINTKSVDIQGTEVITESGTIDFSHLFNVPNYFNKTTDDTDDITDTATNRFTNDTDIARLANTSGTNTGDITVADSSEIDFTLTGQQITASIKDASIDETKLDTSVNASLDLADSAIQTELDPVFNNSEAANITATDITNLGNLSGTNTGDQDLSEYYLIDQSTPQTITGQIINQIDSADYTNVGGAGALIVVKNSNVAGQNVIYSEVNGEMVAKWRTDYAGYINWVAKHMHTFYVGGDYGTGSGVAHIYNSGNLGIGTAFDDDDGNKLQVNGSIRQRTVSENGFVKYTESNGTFGIDTNTYISDISGQDLSTADNTTSAFIKISDVPTVIYSKSFIISYPTATANAPVWKVPNAITITGIHVLCIDGTNVVGRLEELDANGLNPTVVGADITAVAGTIETQTTFTNPGIASSGFVGWRNTSVSGAVTKVNITFDYVIA